MEKISNFNIVKDFFNNPMYDQINNMVRWNGMNRIKDETVGHHTHIVTMLVRIILEELFRDYPYHSYRDRIILECVTYAIFHDFDESFTGDILHGFKHNEINGKDVKKVIEEYLQIVKQKFNGNSNTHKLLKEYAFGDLKLVPFQKKIVKICDWLSMAFYLKKEMDLGNMTVADKYNYNLYAIQVILDDLEEEIDKYMRKNVNKEIIYNLKQFCIDETR